LCNEEKKTAKQNKTRLTNGTLDNLIKYTETKNNLDVGSIDFETVISHVQSNNAIGQQPQKDTPLWQVKKYDC
jgi:hypothetical protein